MRIYPVTNYSYPRYSGRQNLHMQNYNVSSVTYSPSFQSKHSAKKLFTPLFGGLATAGAALGTIIMTGGVAAPFVVAYGAIGAAAGLGLGHIIDKGNKEFEENNKKG